MVPPSSANEGFVLKCADGDLRGFGRPAVERKHEHTRGCGGCIHSALCGVQEHKKKYTSMTAYKTDICQKCAAALGKMELVYKPPIDTNEEEFELDSEPECDKLSKNNKSSAQIQKHFINYSTHKCK
eukprot:5172363-Ditylum_brightwellii.AAC.1